MRRNILRVTSVPLLLLILIAGCASKIDLKKEKNDLLKTDIEFSRTSVEKSTAEAFYLYLTDDTVLLPAGSPPIIGTKAIRDMG